MNNLNNIQNKNKINKENIKDLNIKKAFILNNTYQLTDLKINNYYVAKIEKEWIVLNKNIKINKSNIHFNKNNKNNTENQSHKNNKNNIHNQNNKIVIKIKKLIFPNSIIGESYNIDQFEIKELNNDREIDNNKNNYSNHKNDEINQNIKLKDIDETYLNKKIKITAFVEKIIQTSGPTLFKVKDETGTFLLKGFVRGKRAFPELEEKKGISAIIKIVEHDNSIEGEIIKAFKKEYDENKLINIINENAKPKNTQFTIHSNVYENMSKLFYDAALKIRKAIFNSRPIILRHHADCDGYSAAMAIEEAILKLMKKIHKDEKSIWKYYSRYPNRTPFLDYTDASKDLAFFLDDMVKFGNKAPLYIIVDFGSSNESALAYEKLKAFDTEIIVVDHHYSSSEEFNKIRQFTSIFINPHEHSGDENITAGMLAYELSMMIEPHNLQYLPILSGFGDRSDGYEFKEYLKNNNDLDFLKKFAEVVDFEAYHLKFLEGRTYFRKLFTNNQTQRKIVKQIYSIIEKIWKKYEIIINKNLKVINEKPYVIWLENISSQYDFPNPGKITGFAKDYLVKKLKRDDIVVIYAFEDGFIFRIENYNLKVNEKIQELKKRYPEYLVDGGGHSKAGSLRFLKCGYNTIRKEVVNWFKN